MNSKLAYLAGSTRKFLAAKGMTCPNCGCAEISALARKYLVTRLVRCARCKLLFRTPTTSKEENDAFYQAEYAEGFTTDMPSDEKLRDYLESGFPSEKDYGRYVDVVHAASARPQLRLFDFGCSWGYGSYQFTQHGFDVEAFHGVQAPLARKV